MTPEEVQAVLLAELEQERVQSAAHPNTSLLSAFQIVNITCIGPAGDAQKHSFRAPGAPGCHDSALDVTVLDCAHVRGTALA